MTNLLQETIEAIKEAGKTEADIIFIGSEGSGHSCTWEEYKVLADGEYCGPFGAPQVATDLVIVFSDDTRLVRRDCDCDGRESWEYIPLFIIPSVEDRKPIKALIVDFKELNDWGWSTLAELNKTPT